MNILLIKVFFPLPRWAFALFCCLAACHAAVGGEIAPAAGNKVALVIGNSAYLSVPALTNPEGDAKDVAAALTRLGFTVTKATNVGFDQMRRALLDFGRKAQGADMAIIYFAGHGLEIGGNNWLVPVDAELKTDIDVENEAINLNSAMLAVSDTNSLGLIILDSCRSNPFQSHIQKSSGLTRSIDRGLAPIEPNDNVLVAFAAKDGTTAQDGDGHHSPFTSALLSHLETPGLEINFLFRNIRDDVVAATGHAQEPYVYGSISKDAIYLNPPKPGAVAGPPIGADEIAWSLLQGSSDTDTLQRFVTAFPTSPRLAEARAQIAALSQARVDASRQLGAKTLAELQKPTSQSLTDLVKVAAADKPDEPVESIAHRFSENSDQIEKAWKVIQAGGDQATIRRFVDEFPTTSRKLAIHPRVTTSVVRTRVARRPSQVTHVAMRDPDLAPWDAADAAGAPSTVDRRRPADPNVLVGALSKTYEMSADDRSGACDRLASDPNDSSRPPGLAGTGFDSLDGARAVEACSAAVEAYPDEPRYRYQLCRAFMKVGDRRHASEQCAAAAEAPTNDVFGLSQPSYYAQIVPTLHLPPVANSTIAPAGETLATTGIPTIASPGSPSLGAPTERDLKRTIAPPPPGPILPPLPPPTNGAPPVVFKGPSGPTSTFSSGSPFHSQQRHPKTGQPTNGTSTTNQGNLFVRRIGGVTGSPKTAGSTVFMQRGQRVVPVMRTTTPISAPHLTPVVKTPTPFIAKLAPVTPMVVTPQVVKIPAAAIRITPPAAAIKITIPKIQVQTPLMIKRPAL